MKRIVFGLILLVAVVAGFMSVGATATAETALRPGYSGQINHVVRWGETLIVIADRYGTSPVLIINANKIRNPNHIAVGTRLVIPVKGYVSPGWTAPVPVAHHPPPPHPTHPSKPAPPPPAAGHCIPYTIQPGDTTAGIAAKFGVSVQSLIQVNNLINPSYIHAGVTIRICEVAHVPPAHVAWQPQPVVVVQPVIVVPPPPAPPPVCTKQITVVHGATIHSIATYYGTTVHVVRHLNNLPNDHVWAGMVILVPCPPATPPPPKPQPVVHKPPPQLHPAQCNAAISISYPRQNEHVSGIINIVGTATINNFQFYKVEYGQGAVPIRFNSIGEVVRTQKTGTTLMTWDTTSVPSGEYVLRLTAVDNQGQFPQACNVRVVVTN